MSYRTGTVGVDGGALAYGRWGDAADPVVSIHGVTSSHLAWALVAERLPGLVAPDLRGRGRSAGLPGPWGMARHADDVVRLLDDVGVDRAVLAGHSMGAYVAVVLAHRHPDRVRRLLLVDGGLPLPVPPGVPPERQIEAVIGPAAQRLAMTFPDRAAYQEFWRAHPAFARDWSPAVAAYVDYDLTGEPPRLRSSSSFDAVRADSADLQAGPDYPAALAALHHPAALLRAERGMLDQPEPLYPEPVVEAASRALPALAVSTVAGVNHYTITLSPAGADAVAAALREIAAGAGG